MKNRVLLFLLVGTVAACGVPKAKYTSLQDQMKTCDTQLADMKTASEACESKLSSLSSTKEELAQQLETKTKTYENLVSSLQDEIKTGKVKISEMKDRLTVNLIDKILFDSGSTVLQDEGKAALKKIGDVLKNVQGKRIQVEGHTDNVPVGPTLQKKFPTNWELSTARATAVVRYLAELGIDQKNLSATGYAMFAPVASNDTAEGKHQNRRIEIVLVPQLEVAGR